MNIIHILEMNKNDLSNHILYLYDEISDISKRIKDLEKLLLESKDMAIDLLNYVESSGWTRHRDSEIAETKAYIEKVDKALGET